MTTVTPTAGSEAANGVLEYPIEATDFAVAGIWDWQVQFVLPTGSWSTDVVQIEVKEKLA